MKCIQQRGPLNYRSGEFNSQIRILDITSQDQRNEINEKRDERAMLLQREGRLAELARREKDAIAESNPGNSVFVVLDFKRDRRLIEEQFVQAYMPLMKRTFDRRQETRLALCRDDRQRWETEQNGPRMWEYQENERMEVRNLQLEKDLDDDLAMLQRDMEMKVTDSRDKQMIAGQIKVLRDTKKLDGENYQRIRAQITQQMDQQRKELQLAILLQGQSRDRNETEIRERMTKLEDDQRHDRRQLNESHRSQLRTLQQAVENFTQRYKSMRSNDPEKAKTPISQRSNQSRPTMVSQRVAEVDITPISGIEIVDEAAEERLQDAKRRLAVLNQQLFMVQALA